MRKTNQKILILSLIIVLVILFGIFFLTDRELQDTYVTNMSNESESVDYIQEVTLQEIKDNKAYFIEDLPEYIPGKLGENGVNLNSYKSSQLKEGYKFKLIRIYKQDKKGDMTSEYKFVRDIEKEKSE